MRGCHRGGPIPKLLPRVHRACLDILRLVRSAFLRKEYASFLWRPFSELFWKSFVWVSWAIKSMYIYRIWKNQILFSFIISLLIRLKKIYRKDSSFNSYKLIENCSALVAKSNKWNKLYSMLLVRISKYCEWIECATCLISSFFACPGALLDSTWIECFPWWSCIRRKRLPFWLCRRIVRLLSRHRCRMHSLLLCASSPALFAPYLHCWLLL